MKPTRTFTPREKQRMASLQAQSRAAEREWDALTVQAQRLGVDTRRALDLAMLRRMVRNARHDGSRDVKITRRKPDYKPMWED